MYIYTHTCILTCHMKKQFLTQMACTRAYTCKMACSQARLGERAGMLLDNVLRKCLTYVAHQVKEDERQPPVNAEPTATVDWPS